MKSLHKNLILISCVLFLAAGLAAADNILLGRPTDNSITASVITDQSGEISFEYGTVSGVYGNQTTAVSCTAGIPVKHVISGLTPNTRYYYRLLFRATSGSPWTAGNEYSFHTQRALNSTFKFTVISDSHLGMMGDANRYNQTTLNVAADNPDFHLDLGDAFIMNSATTPSAANTVYANQRPYFGNFSHSAAVFLAIGNHENEEGWNFDDNPSKALLSINARKQYYLNPIPDAFYTGNTDNSLTAITGDHLREDYYAWEWGDVLFVVLDPFQYTMNLPYTPVAGEDNDEIVSGDQWNWTLGEQQFDWFKQTLENSSAKYKFVFSHHVTGGQLTVSSGAGGPGYVRGGAKAAPYFEWGGLNANGTFGFDTKRPGWGDDPIHQLMIDNGVSAFFHGHDHQYAYEKIDGIVYQSVPSPSMTGSGFNLYSESDPYTIKVLDNSGHLRITVSPSQATVDYVGTSTGAVNYSYNIEPSYTGAFYDLTISANPSGSSTTTPAAGVYSYQENEIVNITAAANPGYVFDYWEGDVANPNSASTTVTMDANKTIIANFEESAKSEVALDGTVSSGTANSASSINIAHTTGTGTNRLMLVGVSWNCGTTARTISSVTFTPNGGSAVSLTNVITEQTGTQLRYSAIYSLLNPPSGTTGTVTVTFSGSVSNGIVAGAANFAGVNQTTPLGTPNGTNGSSTSPSVTLTGLNGNELVFDNVFQGAASSSQTLTAGAGQTAQWNEWISNTRAAASTEQAAGSSVTMSWTAASSTFWAVVAVPINPAPPLVTHDLTMAVSPTGSGTTTPPVGVHTYTKNTVVDISATPAEGYVFHHWQGNVADPNSASTTVTIDANKTVTAHFVELPIKYIGNIGTATSKTAGTSLNITTTQSAAAGDAIIIAYATDPNQTLEISVSDSAGNTY